MITFVWVVLKRLIPPALLGEVGPGKFGLRDQIASLIRLKRYETFPLARAIRRLPIGAFPALHPSPPVATKSQNPETSVQVWISRSNCQIMGYFFSLSILSFSFFCSFFCFFSFLVLNLKHPAIVCIGPQNYRIAIDCTPKSQQDHAS